MKKNSLKPVLAVIMLCITLSMFTGASGIAVKALDPEPESILISLGKDAETSMNFAWYTSSEIKRSTVEYCPENGFYGFDNAGIIRVTARSSISKNNRGARTIHKVELQGLKPGTVYVFRVGTSTDGFSHQGEFITAEKNTDNFTFINITDIQGVNSKDYLKWKNTLDRALDKFPETRFLIQTGDMVDNGDSLYQWDLFAEAAENELRKLPIEPAVGNHESLNKNLTNTDFRNFTDRFNITGSVDTGAPYGTVYSFDYGNVHFAVMNTQCGSKNLKKQADWLKKDLAQTKKLWRVVALHRGPYGATYDTTDIRRMWAPVFDEFDVDLVLQGHDHNYVRSYPMENGVRAKSGEGTVYMVGNTGGVKFYPQKIRSWQAVDFQPKIQMYIAVTVEGRKMMIGAYDVKNTLRDSVMLEK